MGKRFPLGQNNSPLRVEGVFQGFARDTSGGTHDLGDGAFHRAVVIVFETFNSWQPRTLMAPSAIRRSINTLIIFSVPELGKNYTRIR